MVQASGNVKSFRNRQRDVGYQITCDGLIPIRSSLAAGHCTMGPANSLIAWRGIVLISRAPSSPNGPAAARACSAPETSSETASCGQTAVNNLSFEIEPAGIFNTTMQDCEGLGS